MFHAYPEEWEWIEKYIARHGRTPSTGAFHTAFPEMVLKKVDDVEHFCEEVRINNSRVVLNQGLDSVIRKLKQGDVQGAIKQLSSEAIRAEASFLGYGSDGDIFREYSDIKAELLRRKERAQKTGFSGIPTGFPSLDELTSGLQPGWMVVVTARAGVGKTRSLIRMGCAATFSGFTSHYAALEQTRPEIATQFYAFASSEFGQSVLRSLDLAQGKGYETGELLKFLQNMSKTIQGRMHVSDNSRGNLTPSAMAAQIERNRADIYFLDFLTLVEGADDWQSIASISTAIKRMATRYQIPIVTAAQINRSGANSKHQGLETISASDRIGQDADLVINAQKFSKSVIVYTIVKYRHGPEGMSFYLKFDPNQGVMEEITYEEAERLRDADDDKEEAAKEKKFTPRKKGSFHAAAIAAKSGSKTSAAGDRAAGTTGAAVGRSAARVRPAKPVVRIKRVR
jgi:KaiC/GvpD/RAD55 family RecA-like ATPase